MANVDIGAVGNNNIGAVQESVVTGITINLDASNLVLASHNLSVYVTNTINLSASSLTITSFNGTMLITNTINLSASNLTLTARTPSVIVGDGSGILPRIFDSENIYIH